MPTLDPALARALVRDLHAYPITDQRAAELAAEVGGLIEAVRAATDGLVLEDEPADFAVALAALAPAADADR